MSEEQVLFFRALRSGLAGPGSPDAVTTARTILGAQSQQLSPGLLALSQRTVGRPTATALARHLFEEPRHLVRTWGQRDTLHIYPADDWSRFIAAMRRWRPGGRVHAIPDDADLAAARRVLAELGEVTRSDLEPHVAAPFLARATKRWGREVGARRFAAGRFLWRLAQAGEISLTAKQGNEQLYAARHHAFPRLAFDPPNADQAALDLSRRYLAVNGPATAHDLAHFFGAGVTVARGWLQRLDESGETTAVSCQGRELVALSEDVDDLRSSPPRGRAWPVRLLPLWDTLLMSHADKSWTVPSAGERPAIWKKAAVVASVVLARGRIVATWSQKRRARRLDVTIHPLSGWKAGRHLAAVRREARAVAAHYELPEAQVEMA